MAALKAIAAAADRYSYMLDGTREGVVLAGRLGSVAAWEDGVVEGNGWRRGELPS